MRTCLTALATLLLISPLVWGQTELERAQSSLNGIDRFGLSIVVETDGDLAENEVLDINQIQDRLSARLVEAGLDPLTEYDGLRQPYLNVHINALEVTQGLIPFAIEIDFIQPVYLDRQLTISTSASTWDDSAVGLVSRDRLNLIPDAVANLLELFIQDFKRMNS